MFDAQEMMMKIGLAAFAALAFATSASAAAPKNSTSENPFAKDQAILSLKNLDLSNAEGQQRLAIRLDQASAAVCGTGAASLHLALEAQRRECLVAVAADVRSQIEARMASAPTSARVASSR